VTLNEAAAGDPTATADRLELLDGLPLVDVGSDPQALAARLIAAHTMLQKAVADALHVASSPGRCKILLDAELQAYR